MSVTNDRDATPEETVRQMVRDLVSYAYKHNMPVTADSKPGTGNVAHRFAVTIDIPARMETDR